MSLVLQLQECALDADAELCNLLHKALAVASKLNLKKFERWVRCELDGYPTSDVPSYRKLRGQLRGRTPYFDKPVAMPSVDLAEKFSSYKAQESVATISEFLARAGGSVEVCWAEQGPLRKHFRVDAEFYISVPTPQFRGVLTAVKTQVLGWSLNLERDGITGNGMQFSDKERKKAVKDADKLTPTIIYNFIQKVERLDQTNNNDGDVNNDIQSDE